MKFYKINFLKFYKKKIYNIFVRQTAATTHYTDKMIS